MIDPQVLFEESKCYLCLGISQAEALELAILSRISVGGFSVAFTSGNIALVGGGTTIAHGLGTTPTLVRAFLFAIANDAGLGVTAGAQMNLEQFWQSSDVIPAFGVVANASSIIIYNDAAVAGNEASIQFGGNGAVPTSFNNFVIRVIAFR